MKSDREKYFDMLNKLCEYIDYIFSKYEQEILRDKIYEVMDWSYYFLQRVDKE